MKQIQLAKWQDHYNSGESARNGTERTSRDTGTERQSGGPGEFRSERKGRTSSHFLAPALMRTAPDPPTHDSFIYSFIDYIFIHAYYMSDTVLAPRM